jgi:simple sugar transport system ATP-binding protein
MTKFIIETKGLTKKFSHLVALNNVNFCLPSEGITGLVGDNGAGKSTLIKIITGNIPATEGEIFFDGKKVELKSPANAIKLGIRTVHQVLQVVGKRAVYENVFMGREKIKKELKFLKIVDKKAEIEETEKMSKEYNCDIDDVKKSMDQLSGGQRQAVVLLKEAFWNPKVLILDEPTTALSADKSKNIFNIIKGLNIPTMVVSHNLLQVMEFCNRIAIIRKGELIGMFDTKDTNLEMISKLMMGYEELACPVK